MERKQLVLVVEDETLLRMEAADVIRELGFEVVEAANADQAISLLENVSAISLVFTDIQMPGSMDGLRLLEVIRNAGRR